MAKLAIKGHKIREEEVIEILAMMGGSNPFGHSGNNPSAVYYIANKYKNFIICADAKDVRDCIIFTLEGFLEKFPYKVGDSVSSKYLKNYKIEKAEWDSHSNKVVYKLQGVGWHSVEDLQPYKEKTMEETDTMNHTSEINLNHPVFKGYNEIELIIPNGWEFERRGDKMFGVRKYPKTYEECCKVMDIDSDNYLSISNLCFDDGDELTTEYERNLLDGLTYLWELKICRDAYWKIAGEQMRLEKPWEPDWDNEDKRKHVITCQGNNIIKDTYFIKNTILAFPTEEMRDAFYENFKDLIEECKEFL